jgi:energy-coupling factor transporter transmembrane protein EcfT
MAVVKFCEDMVVKMYVDSLKEAHQAAIALTVRKFKLHPPQLP